MLVALTKTVGGQSDGEMVLALDLGTTNSVAYLVRKDGVRPISDGQAADHGHQGLLWPSIITCDEDSQLVSGPKAQMARRDGLPTITGSKRFIGRMFQHESVQNLLRGTARPPFKVRSGSKDRPLLYLQCASSNMDVEQPPEFFSAAVLHQLRAVAERQAAKAVKKVVITVPAYFDSSHKQATHDAARMAGFTVLRLVPEPVAAAVAHARTELKRKLPPGMEALKLLVFDWGGGTLDVSVLDITGPGDASGLDDFSVLSIAGDNMLGGDDLDGVLVEYAFDEFKKATGVDASANPGARSRLKHLAEIAKRDLSIKESTSLINAADFFEGKALNVFVTRARFEELAKPIFSRLQPVVQQTLRGAKIDRILMVGGSCRIPRVQNILQEIFDGPSFQKVYMDGMDTLDTSVGFGAALVAQKLLGSSAEEATFEVHNVVPRFLGTSYTCKVNGKFKDDNPVCRKLVRQLPKVRDGSTYFESIVPANARLPFKGTGGGSPSRDNQTHASIEILTGDAEVGYGRDYEQLDIINIEVGLATDEIDDKSFRMTFDVDANGILRVFAASKMEQRELHVGHTLYSPSTQEEINKASKVLQARGAMKALSAAAVDLTNSTEVEVQVQVLLKADMYSEAKALLRESLELVRVEAAKAVDGSKRQEYLRAMITWLEWKLYQHSYLFEPDALSDDKSDSKRRGSTGVCQEAVLTDDTRQKEFSRMVARKLRRIDLEWWADWLGLESVASCTPRTLKKAWIAMSTRYHPDKQSACKKSKLDSGECGCYSQIMVRINAAYDTLKSKCVGVDDGTASNSSSWFSWW